jgi:hypothetical protein
MAVARDELSASLHRLSNFIECRLSDLLVQLLADSRTEAVQSLACSGCRFVESLREARDGREGGEV